MKFLPPLRLLLLRPRGLPTSARKQTHSLSPSEDAPNFPSLGLSPDLVDSLRENFPGIGSPTPCQVGLIPLIVDNTTFSKDVFLKSETGSGKSFGIALALLQRAIASIRMPSAESSSFLILVPHRELALQYHSWLQRLNTTLAVPVSVRLCIRGESKHPLPTDLLDGPSRIPQAASSRTSIIVATASALHTLLAEVSQPVADEFAFPSVSRTRQQPANLNLSVVAVDEIDGMLDLPPRNSSAKKREAWNAHVPLVVQLLDRIYKSTELGGRPQLLLGSATLNVNVRNYVFSKTRWLRPPPSAKDSPPTVAHLDYSSSDGLAFKNQLVEHSCLVVDQDGQARNIDILALEDQDRKQIPYNEQNLGQQRDFQLRKADRGREGNHLVIPVAQEQLIETLAIAVASDVTRSAMLVIPSDWSIAQTVASLQELGVDAEPLVRDAISGSESSRRPILLVSTLATTRGMDLPDLTHVFVMGAKLFGNFNDYVHIAGRVGRISSSTKGKVVTLVMADDERRGEARIAKVYRALGIAPSEWTSSLTDEE